MLHLSTERLAELADTEPSPHELGHLRACAACATEREAHRRLFSLAADERLRLAPALSDWDSLRTRLHDEGLVVSPVRRAVRTWGTTALRIAAAAVLVAGGTAFGRMSAGATPLPWTERASSGTSAFASLAGYGSPDEALDALQAAQSEYERAASYLTLHDSTRYTPEDTDIYRTRLAALDAMAEASRQALFDAPADPVLNQYYISTLGAREATLRQLGTALPVGMKLTRF